METTPLWVPLLVAALGVAGTFVGTVGGVIITQRKADRREALSWTRQREREKAAWAREDTTRTFDHRREAYVDFYQSLRAMALRVYNHGLGLDEANDEELPWEWQFPTFQRIQLLEVYGSGTVAVAASKAYSAVWHWGNGTRHGQDNGEFYEAQERADEAETDLLEAIRHDLSVPDR